MARAAAWSALAVLAVFAASAVAQNARVIRKAQVVDRDKIRVALDSQAAETYEVTDLKTSRERASVSASDGAATLSLADGDVLSLKPRAPVTGKLARGKSYLAGMALWRAPGSADDVVVCRVFVEPASLPLRWNPATSAFETDLQVGVDVGETGAGAFPASFASGVDVRFTCRNASVSRQTVRVKTAGTAGVESVRVAAPSGDPPPEVTASSDLGRGTCTLEVESGFAHLGADCSPDSILGFGLGTTTVTVTAERADGSPYPAASVIPINVHVGRGVAPATAQIAAGESIARFELRSSGTGEDSVTVYSGAIRSDPAKVEYRGLWAFLAIATVGGVVGGLVRGTIAKRRGASTSAVKSILLGAVTGDLVLACVLLGFYAVDVPPPVVGTEAGAAVVAALGGYVGGPMWKRLTSVVAKRKM